MRPRSVGQFLSYARLVRCTHESAGKKQGTGGNKIGNAPWKWAFAEAACLFVRESEQAKKWLARRQKKHGKARALGALAARLGRRLSPITQARGLRRETILRLVKRRSVPGSCWPNWGQPRVSVLVRGKLVDFESGKPR
jgi:hypothetical protein